MEHRTASLVIGVVAGRDVVGKGVVECRAVVPGRTVVAVGVPVITANK